MGSSMLCTSKSRSEINKADEPRIHRMEPQMIKKQAKNRLKQSQFKIVEDQVQVNLDNINLSEQQQLQILKAISFSQALQNSKKNIDISYFSKSNPQYFSYKLDQKNYTSSIIADIQVQSQWVRIEQQYVLEQIKNNQQFWQKQGKIIQLVRKSKIQQEKPKSCLICLEIIDKNNMGVLNCLHYFDRQCIQQHIKACVNANLLKIRCPGENCKELMDASQIQQFADTHTMRKYYEMTFRQYVARNHKDTSWCPSPNCTAVFVYQDNVSDYQCQICGESYCLRCKANSHHGMTCAQFRVNNTRSKEDQKFQQFVKGAKYKKCPSCNFFVQKSAGCDHMTCRCGKQFCYGCGENYPHSGSCKLRN